MRTDYIDYMRQVARRRHNLGELSRLDLSHVERYCSDADTADFEHKPALRDRWIRRAEEILWPIWEDV
jgi:hypothetical protein